jgi:hypothetical protein
MLQTKPTNQIHQHQCTEYTAWYPFRQNDAWITAKSRICTISSTSDDFRCRSLRNFLCFRASSATLLFSCNHDVFPSPRRLQPFISVSKNTPSSTRQRKWCSAVCFESYVMKMTTICCFQWNWHFTNTRNIPSSVPTHSVTSYRWYTS